ncbi:MAG: hypothetical protein QOI24_3472 [Acidobacteriota bacterium]|jgi:hypothetical protein|nr:hypothetical protein [Acidobacteriota bacterium]
MADYTINIFQTHDAGMHFAPDPLNAAANDLISWANRTQSRQQISINGVVFTEVIEPFTSSSPTYVCQGAPGSTIEYESVFNRNLFFGPGKINIVAFLMCVLLIGIFAPPVNAQSQFTEVGCSSIVGQPFKDVPEITTSGNILKGTLVATGSNVIMAIAQGGRQPGPLLAPGPDGKPRIRCFKQWVRAYDTEEGNQKPNASPGNPLPGPTLRGKVGGLVELTFLNLIDPLNFPRADLGKCEPTYTVSNGKKVKVYPTLDKFPDCFNESIITNVHFHGTHTNPGSTGDNVFLQIMPSPRSADSDRTPAVDAASVQTPFAAFFQKCEEELSSATVPKQWPRLWTDAPKSFRTWAENTVKKNEPSDKPWSTQNGAAIENGAWPQYFVGAVPYCYRLPDYTPATWPPASQAVMMSAHAGGAGAAEMDETQSPERPLIMGQAPGTHWYHAHKHGSTTINVSNGMTGVFIIEGKYDEDIRKRLNPPSGPTQHVLVIQQLGGTPFLARGARGVDPYFSVNGQLQPVITMRPGEVQWWRIANTSPPRRNVLPLPEESEARSELEAARPGRRAVQQRELPGEQRQRLSPRLRKSR